MQILSIYIDQFNRLFYVHTIRFMGNHSNFENIYFFRIICFSFIRFAVEE